jgi:peptidoglycan/LPS O-acetylase OafA/YrhL
VSLFGGLDRSGLDMTILAIGTCMVIAASSQTKWKRPRIFKPLCVLGRRSYEVYLTHMFIVYGLFNLFVSLGKPILGVPILFIGVIFIAGVFGDIVARFNSDPLNKLLRKRTTYKAIRPETLEQKPCLTTNLS